MDQERIKRYRDKLAVIQKRLEEIDEWTEGHDAEDFVRDEKTKLATYKAFQEIVEASMDIIAMACKDLKIAPKDDYANIANVPFLDTQMKQVLVEANGLRNWVVHRYNRSDDLIAFGSVTELLPRLAGFVDVVEQWMRTILSAR